MSKNDLHRWRDLQMPDLTKCTDFNEDNVLSGVVSPQIFLWKLESILGWDRADPWLTAPKGAPRYAYC